MPRIGDYQPKSAIAPFIDSSPGPVSAPGLPNAGSAITEANINAARSQSNAIAETGDVMRNTWLKPIGEGLGGIAIGAFSALKTHATAVETMNKLSNTNTAGTAADNLIGKYDDVIGSYIATNKNNLSAYSKENIDKVMQPIMNDFSNARDQLKDSFQPTKTGDLEAYNAYDKSAREYRNQISRQLNKAKYDAMDQQATNNDTNLQARIVKQATTDLSGALSRLDNDASKAIMVSAGTYGKLDARKDDATISYISAQNARMLDSNSFLQQANGDLIKRSQLQGAAFKIFENDVNSTKLLTDITGTEREKMQTMLDTTRKALHAQKDDDIKASTLQDWYTAQHWAAAAASNDKGIRANGINQLNAMLTKEEQKDPQYRSDRVTSTIVSGLKGVAGVQAGRVSEEQAIDISNKNLLNTQQKQNLAEIPKSKESIKAWDNLNNTISDYVAKVKAAKAAIKGGAKNVYIPGTGITVDDMGTLKQEFENNKRLFTPEAIKSFDSDIHNLTRQVVPNFVPQPQPQESTLNLGFDQHAHLTNENDYIAIKRAPLDPYFVAAYLGKKPTAAEVQNLQDLVNTRIDNFRNLNGPYLKAANQSAETVRRAQYMQLLKEKHPVLEGEMPKYAEPIKYFKESKDTLMQHAGKLPNGKSWPTTTDNKQ